MYELVTLDRPFRAIPLEVLIWRVGRGERQSLTQVSRGKFQEVIGQCWSENPAHRPSFKDLLTTIERDVSLLSVSYSGIFIIGSLYVAATSLYNNLRPFTFWIPTYIIM